MEKNRERIALRVSRNTVMANSLLAFIKFIAAIAGHSAAMLSDAVHSLSDVLSTLIVVIGIKISGKRADREHPYGHERFECVAAVILSALLFATGVGIGCAGVRAMAAGRHGAPRIPGSAALFASMFSIAVKEAMFRYTKAAAKRVHSSALMADAWHHRSDALSSVGSFIGIFGARAGYALLDPAASLAICLLICKSALDIFIDAVNKMTDRACDDKTLAEIKTLILEQENVLGVDLLRTRLFGDRIYVDVEISADGDLPLSAGHRIAHTVHDAIETRFEAVKHCMVHVNPKF